MQKYRRMLRGRAIFLLINWLVIVVSVIAWIVVRKPVPTERTISYNRVSDHILVQLAKLPEHPGAQMHTVLMWTLYGDGTLIFRTDPGDNLWRAQLSPSEIQHILDVIINQDTFFDSTAQRYGNMTPERDDNELLLIVSQPIGLPSISRQPMCLPLNSSCLTIILCIPCSMPPTQVAPLTIGGDGIACLPMSSLLPGNTYSLEHVPAMGR